tara:strand:- start:892 stop:1044 length:153 start_codon:yes stop_codon:yes gene_type:complete
MEIILAFNSPRRKNLSDFLIKKIDGCYHNIVGFPLKKFEKSIIKQNLNNL